MRVYNFSAGPATMPLEVLEKAQREFVCFDSLGMSVMEMSHRSKHYRSIMEEAEDKLRNLMQIPDTYKVLFLQGGASLQFAMIPMNLMKLSKTADFIDTGLWSSKAIGEARKFGEARVIASSKANGYTSIPKYKQEQFNQQADYVYICQNNTIYGTKFNTLPDTGGVPLVADVSSCILSEKMDVTRYGLLFAGAQKNLGPAGVTVVIVREDLLERSDERIPVMLNYRTHAMNDSMFNTPPTYAIYMLGLVLDWLLDQGGVEVIEKRNKEKAAMLYDYLDHSQLFRGTAVEADRSLMNVPFITGDEYLDKLFIHLAAEHGLMHLQGHKSVGGMRASLYNAMPIEGVKALVQFMQQFENQYNKKVYTK